MGEILIKREFFSQEERMPITHSTPSVEIRKGLNEDVRKICIDPAAAATAKDGI